MELRFQPIKSNKLLSQQVIERIEEFIRENGLKQGDRLPSEKDLAEAFGVSRLTIRETVQSLSGAGLLKIEPGKGIFLSGNPENAFAMHIDWLLDSEEEIITHSLEARRLIEMSILRLATERALPSDIEELEKLIYEMKIEKNDRDKMINLGLQFHYKTYDIARNKVLNLMLRPLESIIRKKIRKLEAVESVEETHKRTYETHKEIFEAIKSGDPGLAERSGMKHLQEVEKLAEKLKVRYKTIGNN